VARRVPVLASEVGEDDCGGRFLSTLLPWAERERIGYLAWAWNTASCTAGPSLISSYSGTPTAYGAAYRAFLWGSGQRPRLRAVRGAKAMAVGGGAKVRAVGGGAKVRAPLRFAP
jgi:hypothetical protein